MDNPKEDQDQSTTPAQKSGLVLPDQLLPPNLFILPVQSAVIYPTLMAPLVVSKPRFVATVEEAISRQRFLGLLMTREGEVREGLSSEDLYKVGVIVKVVKRLKLPDGSVNLLIQSIKRFKVSKYLSTGPHFVAEVEYLDDQVEKSVELDALTRTVISHVKQLSEMNPFFTEDMKLAMVNAPGPGTVADLVAFALSLSKKDSQEILETLPVKERFEKLLLHLKREQDVADLQRKIQDDVNTKINSMQREFFLKEQLKIIKRELGVEEDDKSKSSRNFETRIEEAKMPEDVKKVALEELEKFRTLSEHSPEYNVSRSYLELLCLLPWSIETQDNLNLDHARGILDEDHFGLEKVKERIIEFLAVRRLTSERNSVVLPKEGESNKPISSAEADEKLSKNRASGSIICLVGPPGVGKTSVGRSIARTLNRKFYRFSLGGMRDEAEIKGHRRTYVGAMPGKIIQSIKRAGTKNPVLMLDEIDKLGQSFQGDPASALLEVLDPEQNSGFVDHYMDVPFDLSNVVFIATANTMTTIPAPLLDRMEIIELPGYTLEEKEKIAMRYVIPKILHATGLTPKDLKIEKSALKQIMLDYAREPGLRTLQQLIEKIARKAAIQVISNKDKKTSGKNTLKNPAVVIREADLKKWLGPKRFYNEMAERITSPGVVVGLAWTAMGGDILFIEATVTSGSGKLKLTGKMGEVMSESANIAWTYVKRKLVADALITEEDLKNKDIHLHIPAGAVPKDGPSAGVTMAVALYSLFTGRISRQKVAMTGELSLIGKVLPVGGIKEKILAAKRSKVTTILLPKLNEKDLEEVPEYALEGLQIHLVSSVDDAFDKVLTPSKGGRPVQAGMLVKELKTQNPREERMSARSVTPKKRKKQPKKRKGSK